jgi:hypothetical protein
MLSPILITVYSSLYTHWVLSVCCPTPVLLYRFQRWPFPFLGSRTMPAPQPQRLLTHSAFSNFTLVAPLHTLSLHSTGAVLQPPTSYLRWLLILFKVEAEVKLRSTVSRPVSTSWWRAPIWSPWPDCCFLFDNCRFLAVVSSFWREDGSVIYSYNCIWAFPEQSILEFKSTELKPYFTVSFTTPPTWRARFSYLYPPGTMWSSRTLGQWVPFSSPLMARRATVEVFQPASTRVN